MPLNLERHCVSIWGPMSSRAVHCLASWVWARVKLSRLDSRDIVHDPERDCALLVSTASLPRRLDVCYCCHIRMTVLYSLSRYYPPRSVWQAHSSSQSSISWVVWLLSPASRGPQALLNAVMHLRSCLWCIVAGMEHCGHFLTHDFGERALSVLSFLKAGFRAADFRFMGLYGPRYLVQNEVVCVLEIADPISPLLSCPASAWSC